MNFEQVCLYCGRRDNSLNYSCSCNHKDWTKEYRMIDIDITPESKKQLLSKSFDSYTFVNPEGFLQYRGLPYRFTITEIRKAAGLTPLHQLNGMAEKYGSRIYVKDEGANPSGCFKDRETVMCMLNSMHNGMNNAVIYSSGNAAASAAFYVEKSNHELITFVPGDTYPEKIEYIRNHGVDVIVIGDNETSFEDGYRLFSEINSTKIFASNGYDNWSVRNPFRVQGDKTIALEIVKQLTDDREVTTVPDYVIVPTANGSCLTGIWKGFKELNEAGIISTLPKMIATGIRHANPVCKAVRLGETDRPVRCDHHKLDSHDAEVGSIIVAEEGYDSIVAARGVLNSGGFEVELHGSDIQNILVEFLNREESLAIDQLLLPEPAALTSLAAIEKLKEQKSLSPSDTVVSVSTGDGMKAENVIISLLEDYAPQRQKAEFILQEKKNNMNRSSTKKGEKINAQANLDSVTESFIELQKKPA